MKKKLLAILALCGCVAISVGMLAGCTDPGQQDETCTQHVDADHDGKCDVCGEDMGGGSVTEVKMTDGVYSNVMDASHEALIKLYEDGTAYLAGFTVSYKGWYEVKEEGITTAAVADDGTIIDDAAAAAGKGEKEWLTFDTAIYFWADEEKTEPIVVNASAASADALPSSGIGYAYGTPVNALAYDGETDRIYNYKFDQATRTLSHSSLREFTEEDENAIEKYKFMLENEADMPDDAPADAVVSDYYITITQKGFEGNLLGEDAVWNGKYTLEGNVYTLNDTFSGESVGTLTIHEDGTATYKNGDTTIELVVWEEVASGEAVDLLSGTDTVNLGIEVTFTLVFRSDCTASLSANVMGSEIEITTDWLLDGSKVTFSNTSGGEFGYTIDGEGAHVTWKGVLSDRIPEQDLAFDFTYADLAKLQNATPSREPELQLSKESSSVELYPGMSITFTLNLYDDGSFTIVGALGSNSIEITGKWSGSSESRSLNFTEISTGATMTGAMSADYQTYTLTYEGNISDQLTGKEMTFAIPTSELTPLFH